VPPAPRKSTAAKKTTAKKTTAKKSTAKKSTAKTSTAKSTATKKAPTKKTTAAQTPAAPAAPASTPSPMPVAAPGAATALGAGNIAAAGVAGVEEAVERIRGLQATLLDTARSGGASYLQAYETALASMLELTQGAAESSQLSWAVTLVNTYSDFVKRVNDAVLKAGRYTLG
jgi:cytoskeletal protein RodZ